MRRPADLDEHEFESLNRSFYRADPAEVIDQRLWMLTQFLGDEQLTASESADGVSMTRAGVPSVEERVQFVALESTLVVHQAAETLLRLCLAHWDNALCPWWELTKLRDRGAFPTGVKRIKNSLQSDETLDELLHIVSWSGDKAVMDASGTWKHPDGWERHRDGLRDLIEYCCDLILDGAELYNAGKHGLAILPEEVEFKINDGKILSASGPALTVIQQVNSGNERRWARVTHWVKYQQSIVMCGLISSAMRSLWECGKQRRIGGADESKITVFDRELVGKARFVQSKMGFNTGTMSVQLFDVAHPMFVPQPPH